MAQAKKVKAPFRYAAEGSQFRLYEYGRKTSKTFKSEAAAKKFVLDGNAPYRKSGERATVPLVKNGAARRFAKSAAKASKQKHSAAMKADLHYLITQWQQELDMLADEINAAEYDGEHEEAERLMKMRNAHAKRKPTMAQVIHMHEQGIPAAYFNPRKRHNRRR
jgi:hypothetical protein